MTREGVQAIADANGFGEVHFQYNVAKNTGKPFEVGYITREGRRDLFCKRQSYAAEDDFYLCNEYREL